MSLDMVGEDTKKTGGSFLDRKNAGSFCYLDTR